jgi:hypothetical protein
MEVMINTYKILIENTEGKVLGGKEHRLDIKMDCK